MLRSASNFGFRGFAYGFLSHLEGLGSNRKIGFWVVGGGGSVGGVPTPRPRLFRFDPSPSKWLKNPYAKPLNPEFEADRTTFIFFETIFLNYFKSDLPGRSTLTK